MPTTVCVQCSLRALLLGEPAPTFDEEPHAHQQRCHPDLAAAKRERQELEAQLRERLGGDYPGLRLPPVTDEEA